MSDVIATELTPDQLERLMRIIGSGEGQPREITDSVPLPAIPAPRFFGAQEVRRVVLAAGNVATLQTGVQTQYADVLFDGNDGLLAVGTYVSAMGGILGINRVGVKIGMQGQQELSVTSSAGATCYVVFNDLPHRIWG